MYLTKSESIWVFLPLYFRRNFVFIQNLMISFLKISYYSKHIGKLYENSERGSSVLLTFTQVSVSCGHQDLPSSISSINHDDKIPFRTVFFFFHQHIASEPHRVTHLSESGSSGPKGTAKWVTNISHSGENRKLALCLLLEGDTEDLWPSTRKYLSPRKCHSAICLNVAIQFESLSL